MKNNHLCNRAMSLVLAIILFASLITPFTLKSKWGMSGLYQHDLTNCPYYYYEGDDFVSINATRFYS